VRFTGSNTEMISAAVFASEAREARVRDIGHATQTKEIAVRVLLFPTSLTRT
jgi:hypothetical protein